MPQLQTHDTQGFPNGINWSSSSESIQPTELTQAKNCEYNREDGSLRTVEGIVTKLEHEEQIDSIFYNKHYHVFYFSSGVDLYMTSDFTTSTHIGTLLGSKKPVYCMYDDACLIATGLQLQAIVGGSSLQTIKTSPPANDFVTTRVGRVVTFTNSSDQLTYSAIGDYNNWDNDPNNISSAQFVNVGYKDAGNIIAVDFLSKAVVVYKDEGRAYKINGEPQDSSFSIDSISQTAFCSSSRSAISVDNKSYYIGKSGFMSFIPTNAFGDVAPFEEGLNINPWLIGNVDTHCQIWRVVSRKQLWIKTQNSPIVFLYHYLPRYQDGRGAFTSRTFSHILNDVCEVEDTVYVAYGNKIGVLSPSTDLDDNQQIETSFTSGTRLSLIRGIVIMNRLIVTHNVLAGYGKLTIGKTVKDLIIGNGSPYIYDANEYIYDANEYINLDSYTRNHRFSEAYNKDVQIKVFIQKGAISLRGLTYQFIEV